VATAGAEAATAEAVVASTEEVSAVAVSTAAVVSVEEVSAVALFTAAVVSVVDASPVAVSAAVAFVVAVSAVAGSTAVAFVATVLVMTDSLMMFLSAASAFRAGGAGAIRTDITTITRTITMAMDTVGTRTAMDTAGTVTTVAPVMDIAMEAERVMDIAMAAAAVPDTAMAADQRIPGVSGVGDKLGDALKYRRPVGVWRSNRK
jgi:hypothetical protein